MHIYFSGIGGAGIGPLALIAKQAGYTVSGSDKQDSQYIQYLKKHGVTDIQIDQSYEAIAQAHATDPIDWFVYSSALPLENPNAPELSFCREQAIHTSKRDELLNQIIQDKKLKLVAIAGTHGKSTTTAMIIWLFKQLCIPIGYSVGAKIGFGDMGEYAAGAEYFVYECDEFDRNFLAFEPYLSVISGVSWDHHDIYPTREEYNEAFHDFIGQSQRTLVWNDDAAYLQLKPADNVSIVNWDDNREVISLKGFYTRLDAWLACGAVRLVTNASAEQLIAHINKFPGLQRRMEQIVPNLYSDYAHTVEKIQGAMSTALEMAEDSNQDLVIIYEPLTNKRQHYIQDDYQDVFKDACHVYWVPSYLAREDPNEHVLTPAELISHLADPSIATPAEPNEKLHATIQSHLDKGDLVVAMTGGGGNSLDEWLRKEFVN